LRVPRFALKILSGVGDGPIYGIPLSDKTSRIRPRKPLRELRHADESQSLIQVLIGVSRMPRIADLVLRAEPPKQPTGSVLVDSPVRIADRAQTEVVRPAAQHPVQL